MKRFTLHQYKIRAHHTSRIIKESLTLIPKKHKQKRNRINKSQFYDINNHPYHKDIIYAYNPNPTPKKGKKR